MILIVNNDPISKLEVMIIGRKLHLLFNLRGNKLFSNLSHSLYQLVPSLIIEFFHTHT